MNMGWGGGGGIKEGLRGGEGRQQDGQQCCPVGDLYRKGDLYGKKFENKAYRPKNKKSARATEVQSATSHSSKVLYLTHPKAAPIVGKISEAGIEEHAQVKEQSSIP